MRHQVKIGVALLTLSTFSFYIPLNIAGLPGYDLSKVPAEFYNYFCWATSGNLFAVMLYSFYLFIFTDPKHYKLKIIFCYLFLAETFTFINYVVHKFFIKEIYDWPQSIAVLLAFSFCFSWFLSRALRNGASDNFNPEKTYITKYKPKNLFGIFNWIINLKGHAAIYQDGMIYKFRKESGVIEPRKLSDRAINKLTSAGQISIEEIERIETIDKFTGRKYSLLKYNCNHLAKDARRQ